MPTDSIALAPSAIPSIAGSGLVTAGPRRLLRIEGALMLLLALWGYRALSGGWAFFAACFLVPDLSLLGYLAGSKLGAAVYNAGHSLLGPAILTGLALYIAPAPLLLRCALIWAAHIGFDRALGYGLKYPGSFFDTHLGRVGRDRATPGS
jgi:hypothetical protein